MYPHELMTSTTYESPSSSPASRKRQLGAFPQHLLQHDDDDEASTDSDSDASQSKRLRHESSPAASPKLTSSRKAALSAVSRPNMTASHSITLEMLRPHFEEPLAQVAKTFGICVTLLKKICRKHGLSRWPHRQITGLRKSIASMEHAIGYFEGERRDAYAQQLRKQKTKLALLLEDPTKCSPTLPLSPQAASPSSMQPPTSSFSSSSYSSPMSSLSKTPVFPSSIYQSPAGDFAAPPSLMGHLRPSRDSFESQQFAYPVLPSGFLSRQQQQQQTYFDSHHQQHFSPPAPIGSVCLPPLRTEPRRMLPPIASLVGNTGAW